MPEPIPPSGHRFKYALFYERPGVRLVLFDNERRKRDRKHIREVETSHTFTTPRPERRTSWPPYGQSRMRMERLKMATGKKVNLHVGEGLEAAGARLVDAWKRAEIGELRPDNAEVHLGFAPWEDMVRVLSPKRLKLLRHLHQHPAPSVRQLAAAVGRDYRLVHDDVAALQDAGLLERDAQGLRADYQAFDMHLKVAL